MHFMARLTSLMLMFLALTCVAQDVALLPIASGLDQPVALTHAGDTRLFITEQTGTIRIHDALGLRATPFLDIRSLVLSGGERGLLSVAFHPRYRDNGLFYVYYTNRNGDNNLARYQVSSDPDRADPASGVVLLTIPHPSFANHNGGQLAFGPDGFLYIGTGDGGSGGDPAENGPNINALLGKLLRIDVNSGSPYGIPPTNPFATATAGNGAHEVWSYGLRNPWRFSFDSLNGDLYVGDVGQDLWEEIDYQPAGAAGGRNYGWDCREGAHDYSDPNGDMNANCGPVTSVDPVLEYDHSLGCAVIGGPVFRNLAGHLMTGNYL